MAATPKETAAVCINNPLHRPIVTSKPAFRPCNADCVKTKMLSGPGTSASATDAAKKITTVSIGIILYFSCIGYVYSKRQAGHPVRNNDIAQTDESFLSKGPIFNKYFQLLSC